MSAWVRRRLAEVEAEGSGVVVVFDHDGLVDPAHLAPEVEVVEDWWSLRAAYERRGRRRPDAAPPLVLVVRPPLSAETLAWDVERASSRTVEVKLPGPREVRAALRELDDDELDRAADAVAAAVADPVAALLRAVSGVALPAGAASLGEQLQLAARLALRSNPSRELARLAARWVADAAVAGLLDAPPRCGELQRRWEEFLAGGGDHWTGVFAQAKSETAALFAAGLLRPAVASGPVEPWARAGVRRPSDEERARVLLESAPAAPADIAGWYAVAEWWGEVRGLVAHGPAELRDGAWARWAELDEAFVPWLREHYGTRLTSASPWPPAVHRIAPFLARRLRDGAAERVLLVVLDGLGHAQWRRLRDRVRVEVVEAGSTLALVPTYTTVSRQAMLAGRLPASSPDTLWTTHPEARRWREHWAGEGVPAARAAYHRVKGRLPHDGIELGDAVATAVVVNALDHLMHKSELFGDAQMLANVDVWAANGFLGDLVARATAAGVEPWITGDHGSLECVGTGAVSEGVGIEAAGKRLLRYPNRTLRDASGARGTVWDGIPGLPATAEPLLFASGRTAFTNNLVSVSHGGLSLDEVVVPLVRVTG